MRFWVFKLMPQMYVLCRPSTNPFPRIYSSTISLTGIEKCIEQLYLCMAKNHDYINRIDNAKMKQRKSWSIVTKLNDRANSSSPETKPSRHTLNNFNCSLAGNLTRFIPPLTDPMTYL